MNKIYIHYGDDVFYPGLIHGPHNDEHFNKPLNALWASPEKSNYSWEVWCKMNDFHTDRLDKFFRFKLKEGAKVLYIDSLDKVKLLPKLLSEYLAIQPYDFDLLKSMGYDAVEISISDCGDLYMALYGWDCDSITVLNPDVVEVIF